MKKVYTSPMIEIECYDLSSSIAAACQSKPEFGPGVPGDPNLNACAGFIEIPDIGFDSIGNSIQSQSFYNGTDGPACDCYYTAGGEGYFSS